MNSSKIRDIFDHCSELFQNESMQYIQPAQENQRQTRSAAIVADHLEESEIIEN